MKLLAIGLWVTLVALGATYGAAVYLPGMSSTAKAAVPTLQYQKARVLNVPMIAGGVVQGFVALQLGYTADAAAMKAVPVPPEVYILDEAFRSVYADPALDFTNLGKYDLAKLTRHLVSATNDRLGGPILKDVMIEQFSYIPKDTLKR